MAVSKGRADASSDTLPLIAAAVAAAEDGPAAPAAPAAAATEIETEEGTEEGALAAYTAGGPPGRRELTAEIMAASLSALGHTPAGGVVFTTATLASLGLCDVAVAELFPHLQKVLLDHNKVTTLRPLTACRSLAYLSVAHNDLAAGEIAALAPLAETLQFLDVSGNALETLDGVGALRYLSTLLAGDNKITVLPDEGPGAVRGLRSLWRLGLAKNGLETVEPRALDGCPLRTLDLGRNKLRDLSPLLTVAATLTALSVEENDIMHLDGAASFQRLSLLELSGNNIYAIEETRLLAGLPMLRTLTLVGNPFCTLSSVADPALSDDAASDVVRSDDDGAPPPAAPRLEAAAALQVPSAAVAAPLRLERNARYAAPSPAEENRVQLVALSEAEQYRLQVLWRLPCVTMLDGRRVAADDACEALALVGDGDASQRCEARRRVETLGGGGGGGVVSTLRKLRDTAPLTE